MFAGRPACSRSRPRDRSAVSTFVDGELHLPGAHPLAQRLAERLEALRAGDARKAGPGEPLLEIVERIAEVFADWRGGELPLQRRASARLPARSRRTAAERPAPHARVHGRTRRRRGRAAHDRARPPLLGVDLGPGAHRRPRLPAGGGVPARAAPPADDSRRAARRDVRFRDRWRCAGCCSSWRSARSFPRRAQRSRGRASRREVVSRIAERIAHSLEERPLVFSPEEYRQRVGDLLARLGGLDHYELLGVLADASVDQVQAAYEELARLVHPMNAPLFQLEGREPALRLLFERATDAYEVLTDPERRRAYNQRQMIEIPSVGPSGEHREAERKSVARSQYERALSYAQRRRRAHRDPAPRAGGQDRLEGRLLVRPRPDAGAQPELAPAGARELSRSAAARPAERRRALRARAALRAARRAGACPGPVRRGGARQPESRRGGRAPALACTRRATTPRARRAVCSPGSSGASSVCYHSSRSESLEAVAPGVRREEESPNSNGQHAR